ncbi:Predicted small periplasmic lipoprotein [Serratia ficaria]|nr:lipoprotein [Serratia ficaria]CAI2074394.1 Predicted small periplasmic lipoprotein [Serratia ficaria]
MLTGLAGCGLKGPLYFPPADPADKKPAATPVQTEQVQKNQQQPSAIQQKPSMTDQ